MTPTTPRTDDFRLERNGDAVTVVFTRTGAAFTFPLGPDGTISAPQVVAPATASPDYDEAEVRRTATELARLAVQGGPPAD
ncbi:hypothetical protein PQJ75_02185 [Rhodoplanes sp. TEM]|uniref:Uncharacterized protein n=1 Tax=Rhodoplanes tepidamans TaxID=200616 RepID=A0ABT5J5X3_RHOTP|nr:MULTISPECIES: hypothetical protein [Rhodoplanes]MDC7785057.1 hypothetical protein [Rhodoplanes tepidamans]MDC7982531.1 hypothetical protein [Rhodoplanes sp. TEM]MDQ0356545.1 hypothetical protein [Rhodoplanes tepidamans]